MLLDDMLKRLKGTVEHSVQSQLEDSLSDMVLVPSDDAINMLRRCLGDEYLAYLLNAEAKDQVPELMSALPRDQLQMLTEIMVLAIPVLLENPDFTTLPGAFCCSHGVGLPLQNYFRTLNGGAKVINDPSGDKLVEHLQNDAVLILPTLTMLEWGDCCDSGSRFKRLQNFYVETRDEFSTLLLQELAATGWRQKLGEAADALYLEEQLCATTTALPVMPLSVLDIKRALLSRAFYEAGTLDYRSGGGRLRSSVSASVCALREMLSGGEVDLPFLMVFEGIKPSTDKTIWLEDGFLRAPTEYEIRMVLPKGVENPMVFAACLSEKLIDLCPSSQVYGDDEAKLVEKVDRFHKEAGKPTWFRYFNEVSTRLRMAILLASDEAHPAVAMVRGCWFYSPLIPCDLQYPDEKKGLLPWELNIGKQFDPDEVTVWYNALMETELPDSTMHRVVMAFSERSRPLDAILDLLIALEGLLGSKTEVSYKLSLFVAKVLHPDDIEKREQCFELVKEAYDVRSTTVHGGSVNAKKHDDAQILSELSIVVLRLFRVLLGERRDLLALSPRKRATRAALE